MIKTALYSKVRECDFEKLFKEKNYTFNTEGAYNLNIIGIRSAGENMVNGYYDVLILIYKTPNNKWQKQIYKITTDPGRYYVLNNNRNGDVALVPGQYKDCYELNKHRGKYEALCQKNKPVKVYTNDRKNEIRDWNPETLEEGKFGINIHKAGNLVDRNTTWSAGCQVFQSNNEFVRFIAFCKKHKELYGNTFTYTLLKEEDLV